MADYSLARQARDLGQLFQFDDDGFSGRVSTGPMGQQQLLREYLRFGGDDSLPEYFLFADVAYRVSVDLDPQPDELRIFLLQGMSYAESVARELSARFEEA